MPYWQIISYYGRTMTAMITSSHDRRISRTADNLVRNPGSLDTVEYKTEQLAQLKLAYAISIHKSQGSEFPCVVIPIHPKNRFMLQRNLVYTGVTRGKQYVVLVGTEEAVDYAIENNRPTQRYTQLRNFLNNKIPTPDEPDKT